jgi:hypothetical protein
MKKKLTPERQEELADSIFSDWKDSIVDKNSKNMPADFGSLFDDFNQKGIEKKIAKKFITKAIVYYTPSASTKKWVYDRLKAENKTQSTRDEFYESWDESISRECRRAYFSFYPLNKQLQQESAQYHPFSTKEDYDKYRQYADSFRTLTPEDLDKLENKRQGDFKDFVNRIIRMSKENGIDISEEELLGNK